MKCTQSLSFSEICQLEFLQNCPGSQSLLHTNEFPEFWNESTPQRRYEPFSRTHSGGYPKRQWEPHSPIA